jgi:hypothetical protein
MTRKINEALGDFRRCCPIQLEKGDTITGLRWFKHKKISECYCFFRIRCLYKCNPDNLSFHREHFQTMKTEEVALDWLINHPVVVEKRWTISREVLDLVLIPDIVEYIVRDYVVHSEIK